VNIDLLLAKSAGELEAISDQELIAELQPYFKFCRPESTLAKKSSAIEGTAIRRPTANVRKSPNASARPSTGQMDLMMAMMLKMAKDKGIDVSKVNVKK
jgi:hypothetical protein